MQDALNIQDSPKGRELTGKHVLAMLVVFFGIIISVSIVFTTLAVKSFRGEDIKQSYRQGVDYNQTLATRAAQNELGWQAATNVIGAANDRALIIQINGPSDQSLHELDVTGRLRHPVDSTLDHPLEFTSLENGRARADLSGLYGQWTVQAIASNGEDALQFNSTIDLR
jgi:nitrogen fixation protein FixH